MKRIILIGVSLGASLAFSAGIAPCYPIAPGDRLLVPANAPAFVGPSGYSNDATMTVRETATDAGLRHLERFDGGQPPFLYVLFAPGPLTKGELITLESNQSTCSAPAPSRADVSVLDAAPFPTELGTLSFGEPEGLLFTLRTYNQTTGALDEEQVRSVKRDVFLVFPDDVLPWLSVMRVPVNGSDPTYGHLARTVTRGSPTVVGSVVTECNRSSDTFAKSVEVTLEIAGHGTVPRAEATVEMDCKLAPPAPGCSAVPGTTLALLGLWLARRRFSVRNRSR